MTNRRQFEIALLYHDTSKQLIANLLGVSLVTLYNKVNNRTNFKASEIYKIADFLKLNRDDVNKIFFDDMLTKSKQSQHV